MKRVRAFVSGRVQGVFFRASTRDKARQLGVTGYVKNLRDGRVEIVAKDDEHAVDNLIEWAKEGPPGARVENVEAHPETPTGDFRDFAVRFY